MSDQNRSRQQAEGSPQGVPARVPKFEMRTMASDAQSIQASGGGEPKPYIPDAQAPAPAAPPPPPQA